MKKIIGVFCLLLALGAVNAPLLPWKSWAADYMRVWLAAHRIKAEFTLDRFEPGVIVIKNISSEVLPTQFDTLDIRYAPRELLDKKLRIISLSLHSKDGEIATQNVTLDLAKPPAASAVVTVKNVPLALIMDLLTTGRAQATGIVSGTLPLTYGEDGSITVRNGVLTASKGGTLVVAPEVIPGDNDQVEVVRTVLKDFHYQIFSMTLNSGKDKKLSMLLQLHGNNPSAYNGREVNLNVRLQGDLLNLYQQNIQAITDPTQLLEQKNENK